MYSSRLLEHFQNPHNVGRLDHPAITVEVVNPACGDIMVLSAHIENGVITRAAYQTRGCTASIAAGSAVTAWMIGKTTQQAAGLRPTDVEALLEGLPSESKHAASLCVDAVKAVLARTV
jgi:nitrogen fixation NifU-like protein